MKGASASHQSLQHAGVTHTKDRRCFVGTTSRGRIPTGTPFHSLLCTETRLEWQETKYTDLDISNGLKCAHSLERCLLIMLTTIDIIARTRVALLILLISLINLAHIASASALIKVKGGAGVTGGDQCLWDDARALTEEWNEAQLCDVSLDKGKQNQVSHVFTIMGLREKTGSAVVSLSFTVLLGTAVRPHRTRYSD